MITEWEDPTYTKTVSKLIKFDVASTSVRFPDQMPPQSPLIRCQVRLSQVPDYLVIRESELPPNENTMGTVSTASNGIYKPCLYFLVLKLFLLISGSNCNTSKLHVATLVCCLNLISFSLKIAF